MNKTFLLIMMSACISASAMAQPGMSYSYECTKDADESTSEWNDAPSKVSLTEDGNTFKLSYIGASTAVSDTPKGAQTFATPVTEVTATLADPDHFGRYYYYAGPLSNQFSTQAKFGISSKMLNHRREPKSGYTVKASFTKPMSEKPEVSIYYSCKSKMTASQK